VTGRLDLSLTFGLPVLPPLGPQNRELLVADGIGDGRFDRGNLRVGRPLGAPREKGVDRRRVAFDVDQDRAIRLVAHPTAEAATPCLALCRRSVFHTLHRARDAGNDSNTILLRHADSLMRRMSKQQPGARNQRIDTKADEANGLEAWIGIGQQLQTALSVSAR
jgi:hypothetical protein